MKKISRCSEATIEKLVLAVEAVLDHGWGGYWSFIKPCKDALEAYRAEIPIVCEICHDSSEKVDYSIILDGNEKKLVCGRCYIREFLNVAQKLQNNKREIAHQRKGW